MRKAIGGFLFVLIALLWANFVFGQESTNSSDNVSAQYTQMQNLLQKLEKEAVKIPFNITRIATQQIEYDTTKLTQQGYELIKHEIERTLRDQERLKVLNLEEFKDQKVLHISGTDSSLSLRNTQRSTSSKENSIRLLELSQKYEIDAFLKGEIQYRSEMGFVVMLQLISPQSREVIWSTSLISKDMDPEEEPNKGKLTLITAGASFLPTNNYLINNNIYNGDIFLLDYAAQLALRQPINNKNSGYIGVRGGYHYYNIMPQGEEGANYEPYDNSIFELGVIFYKTLAEKKEKENEYWIELYLSPNLLVPSGSQNMFGLAQGININLSDNLGLVLNAQYLLSSDPNIENKEETKNIELNTIGYGLMVQFRF